MGRVARYKKVKKSLSTAGASGADYFDTVGVWGLGESGRKVKKRSRTVLKLLAQRKKDVKVAEFDVAPDGDDFDINDLVGSLKREANPDAHVPQPMETLATTSKAAVATKPAVPSTNAIYTEEEKLLKKFEKQVEPQKPVVAAEGRMPGESKRAYNRRVKLETRQIIQRASRQDHNPEKRQKKKDFLNSKKKRGKRKAAANDNDVDDDDLNDDHDDETAPDGNKLWTGEQAVAARARATQVQFGEQAERPPVFQQLPRGAVSTSKKSLASSSAKKQKTSSSSSLGMNEAEIVAEQHTMDLMRRKVQAQYAAIKARRKLAGDFHL